ncbi:hypothetical protein O3M35_001147 [Rhynocoris fuscipes]|uniref:Uncharacterized protein n=1 Tax=Rhynocoris fuscipes TaxID=488301 RepID=A0AAW1DR87_9HEMI
MKLYSILLSAISLVAISAAFTGDDKFLRKYAMMKVYEACFGPDVVKEVRMEMKAAASKCAGMHPHPSPDPLKIIPPNSANHHKTPVHGQENSNSIQEQESAPQAAALVHAHSPAHHEPPPKSTTLDLNKLQQAILAGYNKHSTGQESALQNAALVHSPSSIHAPPSKTSSVDFNKLQQALIDGFAQHTMPAQSYAPPQHPAYVPPQPQILQQPPYRPYQPYQHPNHNSIYYTPNMYQPQPQPYMPAPYYHPPMYQQPYQPMPAYYSGRSSRDLDTRGQLETLSNVMSGKIRNVTCVMQELGYLDGNLEPDYGRMIERIGRLPVADDLKKDMVEGVEFCRQFSQCVPDDRKDKLIREMVRPMFFFRCYKHKKLEACIMKDVRERYNHNDDLSEDNLTVNGDERRSAKEFPEDNMATAIYEFLYGGDRIDIDTLL